MTETRLSEAHAALAEALDFWRRRGLANPGASGMELNDVSKRVQGLTKSPLLDLLRATNGTKVDEHFFRFLSVMEIRQVPIELGLGDESIDAISFCDFAIASATFAIGVQTTEDYEVFAITSYGTFRVASSLAEFLTQYLIDPLELVP